MNVINGFSGEYAWLSNFFVEPSGSTVEHRFQAAKARDDRESRNRILNAPTPGRAKCLGRMVLLDQKWWAKACGPAMYKALIEKFFDSVLREKLLATDDALLIEGNHWHDNYWGDCMCKVCISPGENHLGMLLMEVRTHYRDYERMLEDPLYVSDADIDSIVE
jgi:hypothetical protein